ncbi:MULTISPECIES: cytochrome oxidase small assembly protein [unclassified Comamonas]|nr:MULTISPECIES: cytochrome oxidase small assembly protein [unclassified Comamonas]
MSSQEQRKRNLRLGLILASIVMALFFGIMVRWALMGG